MQKQKNLNRVAIIGCRHIGANSAYSLLLSGAVEELVLIEKDNERLLDELLNLQHSIPTAAPVRVRAGDYRDAADADIAIIAAGSDARPEETTVDLLEKNIAAVREIAGKLRAVNFDGIILVITNPVDVLAQVAQEESGLPGEQVIGSGMIFDRAWLKAFAGARFGVESSAAETYIIGDQGNSETATWCAAKAGSFPLVDFCTPDCPDFDRMLDRISRAAPVNIQRKGYMSFAIGSCVTKICEAVLRDEHFVLPVSTMTDGQYGISGVYLNLPCVIGRGGIERVIKVPLSMEERKGLQDSANLLKNIITKLKSGMALPAAK
jgi:L-lactate dehydrogenase